MEDEDPRSEPAFIYGLYCPDSGELRYIGKANNPDVRFRQHIRYNIKHKLPVNRWVKKLVRNNKLPIMKILEKTYDWCESEKRLIEIARAQGDKLLNVADGGLSPFCPLKTRIANGKRNAAERHNNIWAVMRQLGANIKTCPAHKMARYELARTKFRAAVARHKEAGTIKLFDQLVNDRITGKWNA